MKLKYFSILILLSVFCSCNTNGDDGVITKKTGIISTVAGNGTGGYSGDGGLATSAQLQQPGGLFVDASGNIYIADNNNHRIRKVNVSDGIISTVAGNGTPGYSGDTGQATSAQLNYPLKVCLDGIGNIYISDFDNHRIRKVNASDGIINTVAGNGTPGYSGDTGLATSAQIHQPTGLFVDTSENIYITEFGNHCIRKVNASDDKINTIAGNGTPGYSGDGGLATSAQLLAPFGVFVDGSKNIYIVDRGNNRIRKVNASDGKINTVAGNNGYGYFGDGGLATSAQLFLPQGVFVDGLENIFIADSGNHSIRKVNASDGIINTVAGNGTPGYSGEMSLATSALLGSPEDVFVNGSGNIYIADRSNQRIRKVTYYNEVVFH